MRSALLSVLDRVYVINLASRPDRRREIRIELDRPALKSDEPYVTFFDAIRPDEGGTFPSIGPRGCFLCHGEVLRDAARRGCSSVLICEDDVTFAEDCATRIGMLCGRLGTDDWSVFYGGHAALPIAAAGTGPLVEVAPDIGALTSHCIGFRGT